MDTASRLRINALIDTLVSDGSTFPIPTAADQRGWMLEVAIRSPDSR